MTLNYFNVLLVRREQFGDYSLKRADENPGASPKPSLGLNWDTKVIGVIATHEAEAKMLARDAYSDYRAYRVWVLRTNVSGPSRVDE